MIKKEHLDWIFVDKGVSGYDGVVFGENKIMSYDGVIACKIETPNDISTIVSGDTLKAFLKRCPGETKLADKGDHLMISSGRSRAKLPIIEARQEVESIDFDVEVSNVGDELMDAIDFCLPSAAKGADWGNLASVIIKNNIVLASDGNIVGMFEGNNLDFGQAVISERHVSKILALNPQKAYISREACVFEKTTDEDKITLIVPTMPFETDILDKEKLGILMKAKDHDTTHEIELDAQFNQAVENATIFADHTLLPITVKINDKGIFVKAVSDKGEFSERACKGIKDLDTAWKMPVKFGAILDTQGKPLCPLLYNQNGKRGTFKIEESFGVFTRTFSIKEE